MAGRAAENLRFVNPQKFRVWMAGERAGHRILAHVRFLDFHGLEDSHVARLAAVNNSRILIVDLLDLHLGLFGFRQQAFESVYGQAVQVVFDIGVYLLLKVGSGLKQCGLFKQQVALLCCQAGEFLLKLVEGEALLLGRPSRFFRGCHKNERTFFKFIE